MTSPSSRLIAPWCGWTGPTRPTWYRRGPRRLSGQPALRCRHPGSTGLRACWPPCENGRRPGPSRRRRSWGTAPAARNRQEYRGVHRRASCRTAAASTCGWAAVPLGKGCLAALASHEPRCPVAAVWSATDGSIRWPFGPTPAAPSSNPREFLLRNVPADVAEELTAEEIIFAAVRPSEAKVPACSVILAALPGANVRRFLDALGDTPLAGTTANSSSCNPSTGNPIARRCANCRWCPRVRAWPLGGTPGRERPRANSWCSRRPTLCRSPAGSRT